MVVSRWVKLYYWCRFLLAQQITSQSCHLSCFDYCRKCVSFCCRFLVCPCLEFIQTFLLTYYSFQNAIFESMKKCTLKHFTFLLFLFLIVSSGAHSQYFITGQDPGSTKWRQIKTQYFQVIYPDNYSEWAQYYINVLSLTGPVINSDYKSKVRRISVILHNQTTTSNANAPIAPMRIDIFEMTGQNTHPQIWQDQLALHEYRHTIQQYKLRQGLTKGLYYVFGDQGVAFIMGLYLPFWFIEGDAVYAETIYSNSGRGRVPEFIYTLKAQVLDQVCLHLVDRFTYLRVHFNHRANELGLYPFLEFSRNHVKDFRGQGSKIQGAFVENLKFYFNPKCIRLARLKFNFRKVLHYSKLRMSINQNMVKGSFSGGLMSISFWCRANQATWAR